jgi:hypothetical protein
VRNQTYLVNLRRLWLVLFGPENAKHIKWRQKNLLVTLDLETILQIVCLTVASVVLGGASVSCSDEDDELIKRCAKGERKAFNRLVLKYQKKVFSRNIRT